MIAASAHTPLDRVRREARGDVRPFELERDGEGEAEDGEEPAPTPEPSPEEAHVQTLSDAIRDGRLVEIEYLAVGENVSTRAIEPHALERELPHWYVHSLGPLARRAAVVPARPDAARDAPRRDVRAPPRPRAGEAPRRHDRPRPLHEGLRGLADRARAPGRSTDGTALEELRLGSVDWVIGEILSYRGEAIVLEPPEIRKAIAARAKELRKELFGRKKTRREELASGQAAR